MEAPLPATGITAVFIKTPSMCTLNEMSVSMAVDIGVSCIKVPSVLALCVACAATEVTCWSEVANAYPLTASRVTDRLRND